MIKEISLLNMLQVCDSVFPIGAFTLSNGMETCIRDGHLSTSSDLKTYLESFLSVLPYNELGVMNLAMHAENLGELKNLDHLWASFRGAREVREGSEKLCKRFLKVWERIEDLDELKTYWSMIKKQECYGHHPIVVGLFAKENHLDFKEAGQIYAYSLLSAMTANAVKSVPLSQLEGQKVLNSMFERLIEVVEIASKITSDDIGVGAVQTEIFAMNHEIMYSRMYMS